MMLYAVLLLAASVSAHILNTNNQYHDGNHRLTVQQPVHRPLTRHHVNVHSQQSFTEANVRQVSAHTRQQPTVTPKSVQSRVTPQPSFHQAPEHFVDSDSFDHNAQHPHHETFADLQTRHSVKSENAVATARIVQHDAEVNPDGSFFNVWNSDNGISVQEQGTVKRIGETDVVVSNGEISYTDDEGKTYHLRYVADENGFRPEGDHLPTPPPIPQSIARSLEFIAAHPYVEENSKREGQRMDNSPDVIEN